MVAIAKHEESNELVISDRYSSSEEIRDKYPGKYVCYFCNRELYPVKAGFRKSQCGHLELEVFHRTHFRHACSDSEYCVSARSQSLEHIVSLKFWQEKLAQASHDHFKSAVTPAYEPLLKNIDVTRRPDLGLVYQGKVIGACEVQLSKIGDRQILERSNDHLSLGMAGSWWGFNGLAYQLDYLLKEYGIAYTLELNRMSERIPVVHPVFGNYLVELEIVDKVNLTVRRSGNTTQWNYGAMADEAVTDDFYAQFIESMIRSDGTFPCHNKYVELPPLERRQVKGQGEKRLIPLSELVQEIINLKGVELRDSNSNALGVLQSIDGEFAVVLTPKGEALVPLSYLYINQNIIDECLNREEQLQEQAAIAQNLRAKEKEIRAALIENSTASTPIPNQLILTPVPELQVQTQPQPQPQLRLQQQQLRNPIKIGSLVHWTKAPYYWGAELSKIVGIKGDFVYLQYWKDAIPIDDIQIVK